MLFFHDFQGCVFVFEILFRFIEGRDLAIYLFKYSSLVKSLSLSPEKGEKGLVERAYAKWMQSGTRASTRVSARFKISLALMTKKKGGFFIRHQTSSNLNANEARTKHNHPVRPPTESSLLLPFFYYYFVSSFLFLGGRETWTAGAASWTLVPISLVMRTHAYKTPQNKHTNASIDLLLLKEYIYTYISLLFVYYSQPSKHELRHTTSHKEKRSRFNQPKQKKYRYIYILKVKRQESLDHKKKVSL